jgi:geranylgeranyl diphosphate synthase type II
MEFLTKYLSQIETDLKKVPFPQKPVNLYDPCKYMLDLGGKRIRPALTLMAHKLFDEKYESAIPAALCVELFHNFSLIHDDIMDKAPLRRGQQTVHTKWNETIGILSGDVMLVHSYKLLTNKYDGDILKELLLVYNKTATEVCEGQQMDMDFESRINVTVREYESMISLKTSVLLGCALKMGAITARASKEDADHLYEFGKNIGIAFQLRDDLLDAFGEPGKTGKQPGGDILAGKKTFLVIECHQIANVEDQKKLDNYLHSNSPTKVNDTIELFNKYKVEELTQKEVHKFQAMAMEHLEKVNVKKEDKQPLVDLANYLLNREN